MDPTPIPLPHDAYAARYEAWKDRWPGYDGPWYDRILGRLPRAYVDRQHGDDGAVVYDLDRFDDWWERYAYTLVYWLTWLLTLGLYPARLGLRGLLPHEYGHLAGLDHPPKASLAYWTDVMGGVGLRATDRYGILEDAQAWMTQHDLEA